MKNFLRKLFNVTDVQLTEVQEKISNIPANKNVLILSSCGSGKTEASYYYSLKWGSRVIYALPQRTLATSIYERLKGYNDTLGYEENWTIQHSVLQEDRFLSNKYVVTTVDQVLAGYLGIGVQALIKGRNVVRSNFIFDEIQLFEPNKTLKTTIQMLDALYQRENQFIIMTATMPSYLIKFLSERYQMEVIVTKRPSVEDRKVTIRYQEKLDIAMVNDYQQKQIIICNTQREQIEIYKKIVDQSRCILLNSKLLASDRERVESELAVYFGKNSEENDKILISTQVVEAGMDISASRMYSSISSIDSLIQRDGRVCRWGGEGEIICFLGYYEGIYDEEVVLKTKELLEQNQGISFTWDIQKQWINEVLDPYYTKYVNMREIKKQRPRLKNGNRDELIRGIENVNVIVDYNPSVESARKESVSIHISNMKKIAKWNAVYRFEKNDITVVRESDINVGDTLIIKGTNCSYDKCGFRIEEGQTCLEFPESSKKRESKVYTDYKEESWLLHSTTVRNIMNKKLEQERFSSYVQTNKDKIAEIAGLHDIGKLDSIWQGPLWANATTMPLAHFPFRKGNSLIFKDRNHAVISAHLLKPYTDRIQMNMVLQHHKRYISDGTCVHLKEYELDPRYKRCLKEYGFLNPLKEKDKNRDLTYDNDVMHPADVDWVEFLYLVGTLMESDIEAIQVVQASL